MECDRQLTWQEEARAQAGPCSPKICTWSLDRDNLEIQSSRVQECQKEPSRKEERKEGRKRRGKALESREACLGTGEREEDEEAALNNQPMT